MAENQPKTQPVAEPRKTDEAPAPRPSEQLNPLEMEGRGQTLPAHERKRADAAAELTEMRRKAAEDATRAEMELLEIRRRDVAEEQEKRRADATKEVEAQREGFREQRDRMQPLSVDPATLALEASLNAQLAAALEQDETVPGGAYIVGDDLCDADGRVIGKARG